LKEITMMTEQEQIARCAVVQNALASQRMEGLEPEHQVQEDAQKWVRGEKSISQAVADFKARHQLVSA
jgi:Antitoxin VbhA